MLVEKPGKMSLCLVAIDASMAIAAQQEPRVEVADRLREAVGPVAEAELSLVVGTPDIVGLGGNTLGAPGMLSSMTTAFTDQAVMLQNLCRGGSCGQIPAGMSKL